MMSMTIGVVFAAAMPRRSQIAGSAGAEDPQNTQTVRRATTSATYPIVAIYVTGQPGALAGLALRVMRCRRRTVPSTIFVADSR